MTAVELADKTQIRAILARDPALHVYELGDLDDFFWPHTRWFATDDAIALLYTPGELAVLVALGGEPTRELLAEIRDRLPERVYAHLSPGLVDALAPRFADTCHGDFAKLALGDRAAVDAADTTGAVRLGPDDRAELEAFYAVAYPANWFDPRMLETGQYFAIRDGGIVAAGGVHVYSPAERVAALGNIAVAADHRGRGLGSRVTAAVCKSLLATVDLVGLNVRADNAAALACYRRLGFHRVAGYQEHSLVARRHFGVDYVEHAVLRDGTPVRLRLVTPDDKDLLERGFLRLSDESRYARFLVPKTTLTTDELRYLTEVDQESHFALGAVREDGDGDAVGLGIARFIRTAPTTAEAAIAVSDEVQNQGLGKLLFLRLVAAAAERGIDHFHCEVLCENSAMQELVRRIAPEYTVEIGAGVMSIDFALPPVTPTQPAATPTPPNAMYRFFKAAAENAVEWTDSVRRFWRR